MNKPTLDDTTALSLLLKACKEPEKLTLGQQEIVKAFQGHDPKERNKMLRQLWYDSQIQAYWGEESAPSRVRIVEDAARDYLDNLTGSREAQDFIGESWQSRLRENLISSASRELPAILEGVELPTEWKTNLNLLRVIFAVYRDEFRAEIVVPDGASEPATCRVRLLGDLDRPGGMVKIVY